MDRKTKQAVIGTGIIVGIILLVAAYFIIKAITPSKERMDLTEYYNTEDGIITLIMQDRIYDKRGLLIDDAIYIDYETVVNEFNHRFYWDSNENILTYTTPTELIRAEVGSNDYTVNKSKSSLNYPIVKTNGKEVYVALEFVAMYSDMQYEVYEAPDRVVFTYKWGEYLFTSTKKDTQVRVEPSIKSAILEDVKKDTKLMLVDTGEEAAKNFTKVITEDGVIGYVQNKALNGSDYETVASEYQAPQYTHITKDYTINLVWHQVTNQEANNNLTSLLEGSKGINTISPTWFSVTSNDGTITSLASESYVEKAHNLGLEVWGLIDDFNSDVSMYEVLSRTSTREKLINELVAETIKYNLDGINIDFEKINADSAPHYIQFLRELSIKCRSNGIVLSVDNYVPAAYNMFYDRTEQGIIVDYVVVMGYDEHHASSDVSGSVSSLSFFEKGLKDTLEEVEADRIIMAMPFYTRIWKETTENGETKVTSEERSMSSAWEFMTGNGAEPAWDEESGQYYAEFEQDGVLYKCWFEEDESIEERMKVVSENEIAGVAAWRLGFEKSSVWNIIMKYVN